MRSSPVYNDGLRELRWNPCCFEPTYVDYSLRLYPLLSLVVCCRPFDRDREFISLVHQIDLMCATFLQLRNEWGYPYFVTTDAGSVDLLITLHGTCATRECAAKAALENGIQGEMGGGTYTYETLPGEYYIVVLCMSTESASHR